DASELVFDGTNNPALKFEKAPYDILLKTYAEATGKTLLISPNVPKAEGITLRSQPGVMLSKEEYLQAIETVLVMNGIALDPTGDKFLRVLPASELRKLGVKTNFDEPEGGAHPEDGKMVSQIIQLKSISIEEAKKVIEGFKRGEGQIQLFERTNSILVTDTAENVNRMMEILKYVDIPVENREETHVRPIKFAKAADIKKRLEEVIAEALKDQEQNKATTTVEAKQSGAPGFVRREVTTPPGVVRPRAAAAAAQQPAAKANDIIESLVSDAERGIIRGKVQIVADERTNVLIFLTRPENMTFFDRIIDVLDVEVQSTPDVVVEVMRLEYAIAKDVASMLNDLIGNNSAKDESQDAKSTIADKNDDGGSSSLADAANRTRRRDAAAPESEKKSRLGELNKDNVKILADERSNSVIVMAAPADVESIRSIVSRMDIQLSQVVIEAVIASITFEDSQETGMDWVQRAMLTYNKKGGDPKFAYATAGGGGSLTPRDTPSMTTVNSFTASGGVTGWFTLFDLNMDIVLKAIQTDSRSRIMSSPRITTMDNKEATLEDTKRIYWSEGSTHYTSSDYYSDNIKNEDIGIKLKVTPRINKKGYIDLEIEQEIQTSEGTQAITTRDSTSTFPNLVSRKMSADVAVQSGETVVLGGLADTSVSRTRTKVPILGSIPLLGWLFRHDEETTSRREIIVFITPRVIDTPAQMEDDARKIKASMDTAGVWDASWSNSRLADPLPEKAARKVLENGTQTVTPARYPLTGYLTGLNGSSVTNGMPDESPINKALNETPPGQVPYVHYSDIDDGAAAAETRGHGEDGRAP
ncbi:MAG: type II secretion system secretin GspD, partial [Kiritimatiellae bacterium]|nr:type II secretion system secretin GspD [Kiritimatiellia bacterium]